MHLHPVDRDAFAAALSDAKVGTALSDGCTPGLVAVRVPTETARYLLAALADSLGLAAYDRLQPRPRPDSAGDVPSDIAVMCMGPDLRDRLTLAFGASTEVGDREGRLAIGLPDDAAKDLLATAALALNVEIR